MKEIIFYFVMFISVVLLVNSCRVHIEKTTTTVMDNPKKVLLEGHEYWVSDTNICHSVSCSMCVDKDR